MNKLKIGQRIRLEGVVKELHRGNYWILLNGDDNSLYLNQSEADQAEIISEANEWEQTKCWQPTTATTEPDKWQPKYLDELEWSNNTIGWRPGKYGCKHIDGNHIIFQSDEMIGYATNIRPIPPKAVTAERELKEIIYIYDANGGFNQLISSILAWHTKHTSLINQKFIDYMYEQYDVNLRQSELDDIFKIVQLNPQPK